MTLCITVRDLFINCTISYSTIFHGDNYISVALNFRHIFHKFKIIVVVANVNFCELVRVLSGVNKCPSFIYVFQMFLAELEFASESKPVSGFGSV